MEEIEDRPMDIGLKAVLEACDTQSGRYPAAPTLAAGLSLIAIALPLVTTQLEAMVERGEHLPPEVDRLANDLFNRGTMALSMLHRLALND